MSPLRLGKGERDGKPARARKRDRRARDERRSGNERRSGRDRRERARHIRDLYRSDLDRHLWSWAAGKSPRRKKKEREAAAGRRRRTAGVVASVAGAVGAVAGVSWLLFKKVRNNVGSDDPETVQGDLDEADFED